MSLESDSERDKRGKFLELATKRVNRTLKDLALVSNLANRRNYEYTEDEAKKIIKVLQAELDSVKHNFNAGVQSSKSKFKL